MIRYAVSSDADWLLSQMQANTDVCNILPSKEALEKEIGRKMYLVDEDDDTGALCSFVKFVVWPEYIRTFLIITDESCRNNGHASLLYQYLLAKYQKPIRYLVEAGSESERIWTMRNERVENLTKQVRSVTASDGTSFNQYEAQGLPK